MIELYVLRQSNDIFKDILTPFSARQNERYFYKSFGVPSNENEYFNNIYNLDRNESLKEKVYCKFINSIPLQNTTDIFTKVKDSFKFKDLTQKDFVFQKCFEFCNLTGIPEEMQKEMKVAFVNVCNHWFQYTQKNKKVTFDMLINFGVKMTAWVNSTIPQIICGLVNKTDNVAKVLFYGDIREHEFYFLVLLFNFGCDILYINTVNVKKDFLEQFGQSVSQETFCELPEFPKKEVICAYETNALKAQQEVEDIYYNSDSLKPWQLKDYDIKSVPLKITYEELFNLWKVNSNIRPGFKIQNDTVYIPNLCCKISGVEENLTDFRKKIQNLKTSNTVIYEDIIDEELIASKKMQIELFLKENTNTLQRLDFGRVKMQPFYEYRYLDMSVQNRIFTLYSTMVQTKIANSKIAFCLAVLFSLNKPILNLLQNFDYGFDIPKIIVYHISESALSTWEKIVLKILNNLCFDILYITPTRYCDIDEIFNSEIINIFTLEQSKFDLRNPFLETANVDKKKGFWERLFSDE